ncbi:hypothetical protein TKK_0016000 [Trichogramma kaykai]
MSLLNGSPLIFVVFTALTTVTGIFVNSGHRAYRVQFKYQVALTNAQSEHVLCGGGIIAPSFILTDSHCVCDRKNRIITGKLFVVVGATDFSDLHEQRIQVQVTKIYLPKKYTNVNPHPGQEFLPKADIAVLKLKNALDLESKPFQLAEALSFGSTSSDWVNAMATIAGYGLYDIDWGNIKVDAASNEILQYGSTSYNSLRWIKTRVLSNDICRDKYNVPVEPEQVCAIALSDLEDADAHCTRGICHGDSDSPLVVEERIAVGNRVLRRLYPQGHGQREIRGYTGSGFRDEGFEEA